MSYKKYASDYRLDVQERPGKKPRTITVYIGPRFAYLAGPDVISPLRRLLPAAAAVSVICFAASLFLNCSVTRHLYVILPYFCSFLPYCYLCAAICGFLYRKTPYTREQNDTIAGRIPTCSLIPLILNCYSLAAAVVSMFLSRETLRPVQDAVFLVLCALQIVCCAAVFRQRGRLETHEL